MVSEQWYTLGNNRRINLRTKGFAKVDFYFLWRPQNANLFCWLMSHWFRGACIASIIC